VTTFVTRTAEDYAFVTRPANGSTNAEVVNLGVTANLVPDARRYTIELNTAPDFTGTSFVKTSTKDFQRTLIFERLQYQTVYYARVKTELSPNYGRTTRFTTRAEIFAHLTEPQGTGVDPAVVKLAALNVTGARRYTIELSTTPDFSGSTLVLTSKEDNQRVFILRDLAHATTYYARVKTDISSAFGDVRNFTTRDPIPYQRLWGVTTSGGAYVSGTIFSFSLDSGTFTKHHDYQPDYEGKYLHGNLVRTASGDFFGVSVYEGTGDGSVFSFTEDNQFTLLNTFGPHQGGIMLASNNYLYITDDWINIFRGGVYRIYSEGDDVPVLKRIIYKFNSSTEGRNPQAPLCEYNGYLYGTAPTGGSFNKGTVFRIQPNGTGFQVVHHFNGTNGEGPIASLIDGKDGYLYGMTPLGGSAGTGTVFKLRPDGSGYVKLRDLNGSTGQSPFGDLLLYGNQLFGMTSQGGSGGRGTVFRVNKDGTGFTVMHHFNGTNGANPRGGLVAGRNNSLYGMTSRGGTNNQGVIFTIQASGTGFKKLYDFNTADGGVPDGNLLWMEDPYAPASPATIAQREGTEEPGSTIMASVYPNPFITAFTAEVRSDEPGDYRIILYDSNGRMLSDRRVSSNQPVLLGDDLKKGIYLMKIIKDSKEAVHRVVKN
jgi:uncharacterized repeat protein (TIGR03803 family)